jgi:cation transport ATPase
VLVESSADKTVSESAVALQASVPSKPRGKAIYTCPMHPEVQEDHPGDCPKCGMALELKTVTVGTDDEENVELRDMTKRFSIGAALALPVFVLAMTHLIPALARQPWVDSNASRWLQLALASPVTGLEPLEASAVKLQEEGKTAIFVAIDGTPAGILAVADPIKSTTSEAIGELHALGLQIVMLTGDNRRTAGAVAKKLGLDAVEAEIEPAGKVAHVKKLRAEGKHVAMAGDGINDAPALSEAEVGIAKGTGTDVAMQSAGVTLVKGDLRGIAKAIRLSRGTMRNIVKTCSSPFSTTRWVFLWRRVCFTRSSACCSARSLPAPR